MSGPPAKKQVTHEHTFPPFPTAPLGTVITTFKEFNERGISIAAVSGKEVDACGIPTVALEAHHSTDRCKTDATDRVLTVKLKAKVRGSGSSAKRREWWEEWEEADDSARILEYNPTISRLERFQKAVQDFNKNRTWPSNQSGVRALWDQFQTYIGQLDSTQTRGPKQEEDEAKEDLDDSSDDDAGEPSQQPEGEEGSATENTNSVATEKTLAFLKNPDRIVRIFLSSDLRRQGLHLTPRNLFILPRLLFAFFKYLIRNGVFADKKGDDTFREALKTVEIALIELPLTSKLSKELPDDFNGALNEFYQIKKQRDIWSATTDGVDDFRESTGESALDSDQKKDDESQSPISDWGAGTSWSISEANSFDDWKDSSNEIWGSDHAQTDNDSVEWVYPPPRTLFPVLGPTALPMTHQTGIVESGVRKVKSVTAPAAPQQKPAGYMLHDNAHGDPLAVEADLAGRFFKVELEPWLGWEDASQEPEGVIPHILEASKGAVVIQEKVVFEPGSREKVGVEVGHEGEKVVYSSTSGLKPFKPTTDTISVLVLPSVGEQLRVGMGLGGTWAQLLRCGDFVDDGVQQGKKGKGKNVGQRYWYMDDLMITLTSYHTV